jgi:hypothetical protein
MKSSRKGILLAAVQLILVASLAAKYEIDRVRFPRVWAQSVTYDPDLPIRGRYLALRLRLDADRVYENSPLPNGSRGNFWGDQRDVSLHAESGHLVAIPAGQPTGLRVTRWPLRNGVVVSGLSEPVLFFLPEHFQLPPRGPQGEELWVEVTVPARGPPRPIRLAVKLGDTFTPLDIK